MLAKIQSFLTMFEMELDDLHQDVELLIAQYTIDHDHEAISNYVFYENLALMRNELFGIDSFRSEVRDISPVHYNNVYELIEDLKKRLLQRCHDKGIAAAAYILSERKMNKIISYIEKETPVTMV
jgi:hypothetical protein